MYIYPAIRGEILPDNWIRHNDMVVNPKIFPGREETIFNPGPKILPGKDPGTYFPHSRPDHVVIRRPMGF